MLIFYTEIIYELHTFWFKIVVTVLHDTERWIILELIRPLRNKSENTFTDFIMRGLSWDH